mmetsp:Transcript_10339/g.19559  ORF Transcript_10339/g.19559 Transcript_10339/m.19559 type:complete len:291 (+) Transcript_10339:1920-2792(+)
MLNFCRQSACLERSDLLVVLIVDIVDFVQVLHLLLTESLCKRHLKLLSAVLVIGPELVHPVFSFELFCPNLFVVLCLHLFNLTMEFLLLFDQMSFTITLDFSNFGILVEKFFLKLQLGILCLIFEYLLRFLVCFFDSSNLSRVLGFKGTHFLFVSCFFQGNFVFISKHQLSQPALKLGFHRVLLILELIFQILQSCLVSCSHPMHGILVLFHHFLCSTLVLQFQLFQRRVFFAHHCREFVCLDLHSRVVLSGQASNSGIMLILLTLGFFRVHFHHVSDSEFMLSLHLHGC